MEEGNSPTPRKSFKAPPEAKRPKLAAVDRGNFKNVENSIHRPDTPSTKKRAVFIVSIILFIFVGQSRATLLVQVSTPFDPYRLECPRKFGVVKLIVQKIQSVGRLRDDLMVAAFCRNITEIYPSPFDRHFVEDDEDCRWTTPVELPGPDFAFRNACSDREFLAGISRQESTEYEFLCCRNRDKKRRKCFANQYNYPLSHDLPEVVIERKGLLITSLAYQQKHLVVQFCDFNVVNQEEIDQEAFVETKQKIAALEEMERKTTKKPLLIGSSVERRLKALAQEKPQRQRIVQVKTIGSNSRISDLEQRGRQQFASADNRLARLNRPKSPERKKPLTLRLPPTTTRRPLPKVQIVRAKSAPKIGRSSDPDIKYTLTPEIEEIVKDLEAAENDDRGLTPAPELDSSTLLATSITDDDEDEEENEEKEEGISVKTTKNAEENAEDEESEEDQVTEVTEGGFKTKFLHIRPSTTKSGTASATKKKINVLEVTAQSKFTATHAPKSFSPKSPSAASGSIEKLLRDKNVSTTSKKKMKIIVKKVIKMSSNGEKSAILSSPVTALKLGPPPTTIKTTTDKNLHKIFASSTPKANNTDLFLKHLAEVQAKIKKRLLEEDVETRSRFTNRVIRTPLKIDNKTTSDIEFLDQEKTKINQNILQSNVKYKRKPLKSRRKLVKIRRATGEVVAKIDSDRNDDDVDHVDIELSPNGKNDTNRNNNAEYFYYYYYVDGLNDRKDQEARQAVCDKDRAATQETSGMVIACGQGPSVWTPPRCPDGTSCVQSLDSTFRICCPFRSHLFRL